MSGQKIIDVSRVKKIRAFIRTIPAKQCSMRLWPFGSEGTYGSVACLGGWITAYLKENTGHAHPAAREWLLMEGSGAAQAVWDKLFMSYPARLPEGVSWKRWMLARLTDIIERDGRLVHWRTAMHGRFKGVVRKKRKQS